MKLSKAIDAKLDLQVSPLIDVVFLLLIYFMVTAALVKKEADIAFALPMTDGVEIAMPVEVLVEIGADGSVVVEGMRFSSDNQSLAGLVAQVSSLKQLAASQQSGFFVNIVPHQDARHRRVIDVMDACAAAGVEKLGFSRFI